MRQAVRDAKPEALAVDPLDPSNHDKPMWVVYGISPFWPQLLCAKVLPHDGGGVLPPSVNIWGYSVWKRKPGFRTLGVAVQEWSARHAFGPFFYDRQEFALAHLKAVSSPSPRAR